MSDAQLLVPEEVKVFISALPNDIRAKLSFYDIDRLRKLMPHQTELRELKAAVRWLNSYAYIEGDLDSHCQGVIDDAEESSSDADKAHAETLLKVLSE